MKGKKHTPEQIIQKLREADAHLASGKTIGEICQQLAISEQTFHRWSNQYGGIVNRKRICHLWVMEGLKVPRKVREKRALGTRAGGCVLRPAEPKDHVWTWNFIFDRTANGRVLKILSIVDEYTRECLNLTVSRKLTSADVIDVLAVLFVIRGVPKCIRSDNGPEFVAKATWSSNGRFLLRFFHGAYRWIAYFSTGHDFKTSDRDAASGWGLNSIVRRHFHRVN